MKLIEINNKHSKKLFNKLPRIIYKNDPNFACPLDRMVEETFDQKKNPFFNHGEAIRWVVVNDKNKPIGRIAAFIDYDKAEVFEQPTGNIGFFESINDKEISSLLFDCAKDWLEKRGIEAMDGPANLGENYINHGLLVMGYKPQSFGMPYNQPYYVNLFEHYGFKVYYEQYSYHYDCTKPLEPRFKKIAQWVAKKPQYSFKHFTWDKVDVFLADFATVYKAAWSKHEHYKPLDNDELKGFINGSKILLDPEFIWFAYDNDEPIALFVMIPDFNEALRYIGNGKLSLINIIKLKRFLKANKFTRTRVLVMGVGDKHQRSGIESALFLTIENEIMQQRPGIREVELSWAGDFNPKIVSLYKSTGAVHAKTHYQMRYLFDREKPFIRAAVIR